MANIENLPPTNISETDHKHSAAKPKDKVVTSDRKKLQALQPSSKNQKLLVGADGILGMSGSKKNQKIIIYEDPIQSSTPEKKGVKDKDVQAVVETNERESQVEDADTAQAKAEDFMYSEEHPPEYWKELVEKTREALEASLIENEELHTSLSVLEEEKTALIEERDELRNMAQQAEELSKIVKGLISSEEENSEDDSGDSDENDDTQEGEEHDA